MSDIYVYILKLTILGYGTLELNERYNCAQALRHRVPQRAVRVPVGPQTAVVSNLQRTGGLRGHLWVQDGVREALVLRQQPQT